MLKVGDTLVCSVGRDYNGNSILIKGNRSDDRFSAVRDITYGKTYVVKYIRDLPEKDICIIDNFGNRWWFGQIGSTECWTGWFVTKLEWERNQKIEKILV